MRILVRWPGRSTALALLAALAVSACGGSAASQASGSEVVGRAGSIEIIDPYVPAPASPSVAALYVTLRNTGATPDALTSLSTTVAGSSMLMAEVSSGPDEGTMKQLRSVDIPPNAEIALSPGHDHGMLENPSTGSLKVGSRIAVTLTFAHAGDTTVEVPVVPLTSVVGGSSGGMSNMPGM